MYIEIGRRERATDKEQSAIVIRDRDNRSRPRVDDDVFGFFFFFFGVCIVVGGDKGSLFN